MKKDMKNEYRNISNAYDLLGVFGFLIAALG